MKYIEIKTGSWDEDKPLPWWCKVLQKVIPAANPDLETQYYPLTRFWWVEIDDEYIPQREIGFDENKQPIVLGPIGHNYGFIVDSIVKWEDEEEQTTILQADFQQTWEELWPKFEHLKN